MEFSLLRAGSQLHGDTATCWSEREWKNIITTLQQTWKQICLSCIEITEKLHLRQVRDSFWYSQPVSDRLKKVKTTGACQGRHKTKYKAKMVLVQAVISQYMTTQPRQQLMDGHMWRTWDCFPLGVVCLEGEAGQGWSLEVPFRTPGLHSSPTARV